MAATTEKLGELHEFLCDQLKDSILKLKEAGEPVPASLYKEVREFLKDNDIEASTAPDSAAADLLRAAGAPTFEEDEMYSH